MVTHGGPKLLRLFELSFREQHHIRDGPSLDSELRILDICEEGLARASLSFDSCAFLLSAKHCSVYLFPDRFLAALEFYIPLELLNVLLHLSLRDFLPGLLFHILNCRQGISYFLDRDFLMDYRVSEGRGCFLECLQKRSHFVDRKILGNHFLD